ncbi:MAG: glycosyltransferase family 39 protein [Deltaproteobacteria bacterium]|nr:glycosyltransferase family 39 protein [Deltaproteobacteria bacterium]
MCPILSKNASFINNGIDHSGVRRRTIILILVLGFLLRLYACLNTYIINPDGTIYIHQARAMLYGQWEQLTNCVMGYITPYPPLILGAYFIFKDWIVAARSVSLLFGTLSLIPLYLLLRQFFRRGIASAGLLMFAVTPFLVSQSADVIRDPLYWFLILTGLYFFIRQVDRPTYRLSLILSSLSFLVATWERTEGMLFVILSLLFLLLVKQDKRWRRLFYFGLPLLPVIVFAMLDVSFLNSPVKQILRLSSIKSIFLRPFQQYHEIRSATRSLANPTLDHRLLSFLEKASNLAWLVGLGALVAHVMKAFFYPFFLVFLAGIPEMVKRSSKDKRIAYLFLLSVAGLIVIYLYLLGTWLIYSRFMVLFVFPSFVFAGLGLERILRHMESGFKLGHTAVLAIIILLMVAVTLPKNLEHREKDKALFKNMGEFIAQSEGNSRVVHVLGLPSSSVAWISFYANLNYPGAPCPLVVDPGKTMWDSYDQFLQRLKQDNVHYFLYEERRWPKKGFDILEELNPRDLILLMEADHRDTGRILLFRVRKDA